MTDLEGDGLLALWNGVEAARRREYEAWHAREHVPERLSVPGMIGARRYARIDGPLADHLTLYSMHDLKVLASPPYRRLLENPTQWSRSMRPSFRGFMRLCCRRVMTRGGGVGGVLAALVLDDEAPVDGAGFRDALAGLLREPALTAVHLARRDPSVADVPFAIGGGAPDVPRGGAVLVEACDRAMLAESLPVISEAVAGFAPGAEATLTTYSLACALSAATLDRLALLDQAGFRGRAGPV
jgi:hypothetical protein